MKTTSTIGKGLIARFNTLAVGQQCQFPSLLPNLTNRATQAFLMTRIPGKRWEFKLFWLGVEVGSVVAHIAGDQLELEVS